MRGGIEHSGTEARTRAAPPDPDRDEGLAPHERLGRPFNLLLLVAWALAALVIPYCARDLDWRFAGWSFSYWMAAQGSLLMFLAITVAYAARMNRLDREAGRDRVDLDAG